MTQERDVVLLDGGMGQELRRRSSQPVTPLWSAQVMLDEPDLVTAAHRDFIQAGARVITANTYSATPQRLARDGAPELFDSLHAAALDAARQARDASGQQDVRIAGCLPPLVASYRPDVAPNDADCLEGYRRMVEAQAQAQGVDLFICETMSLAREARAATEAAVESNLPVWVAFTVDDGDGTRLRSGESLIQAAQAVVAAGAERVLVNCAIPEAVTTAMGELTGLGVPFGGYANAFTSVAALQPGGTVDVLESRTDLDPAAYAEHALHWVEQGATLVGGCCEVGPAHIAELAERLTAAGYRVVSS
ncbi:homocysteine S-methyltransferase family protein [Halorhodospira halophila]|uniref:Homocysteine S-methyltransferase n=1 Tax=Halorhodospira halophila (strain DSM 244 / SL1) TaxID=349124 RepID=A1WU24_HALHL|nr:homocysteine S-methyltransferase family protein [Halorhodospira halophila]ABM61186.1 homocysteine S-methyltransferase [Halorhodospira halophila SL1]MBK1729621.1 homocysteine S-methyltransferase family protein [Halorhodospira halophila]